MMRGRDTGRERLSFLMETLTRDSMPMERETAMLVLKNHYYTFIGNLRGCINLNRVPVTRVTMTIT